MQTLYGTPGGVIEKVPFVVPENDEGEQDMTNHLFLEGLGLGFIALMMVGQKITGDLASLQSNGNRAMRPESMLQPSRSFKPGA